MAVYRRCNQCDYYIRASKKKATRALDQHQTATGHVGSGRVLGEPITPLTPSTPEEGTAMWKIVTENDDQEWPCAIVDKQGRSLLAVHNGTPIIRDRALAERIVTALNEPIASPAPSKEGDDDA